MRAFSIATAAAAFILGATSAMAGPSAGPLVSVDWLKSHLDNEEVVILDVRHKLAGTSKEDYTKGHIPGALWTDYPTGWRVERNNVPGVIPDLSAIETHIGNYGIDETKTVVIVPSGTNATEFGSAARIYWTLKYLGHDAVTILDGGHAKWASDSANPLETGNATAEPSIFTAEVREKLLASTADVRAAMDDKSVTLVDGRPVAQFTGKAKHPFATRYGRIPGALNLDQSNFYDSKANALISRDAMSKIVPASIAERDKTLVSYCNTGHWAATNWFVLHELLGYKNISLYDDSMVGWTRDESLPIASERTRFDDLIAWWNDLTG